MNIVNFNGQIFPASTPLFAADNRSFNYGDGLFETMRVYQGRILFVQKHWERLSKGMDLLQLHWPAEFTWVDFEKECLKLYPGTGHFRLRFTAWRAGAGLYTPTFHHANFLITGSPLSEAPYPLNKGGISLFLFEKKALQPDAYSSIKSTSAQTYILAAMAKQTNNWEECLLLNTAGRIAEASSSNVFILKNQRVVTPPLTEGCIAGVLRRVILEELNKAGWDVEEREITEKELIAADEVFLSNSIQGIKWVKSYKNTTFVHQKTIDIHALISAIAKK